MTSARDFPLPAHLDGRARRWLTARGSTPIASPHPADGAPPALAATVVLVRDGRPATDAVRVWTMRRASTMAFAAGVHAFPGGRVDPVDRDRLPWQGPSPSWFAARIGAGAATARALVHAAVRELFEESGVLLARPVDPARPVAPVTDTDRQAIWRRTLSLADLLDRSGLVLAADRLRPWARWTTPRFEPRRYDTVFWRVTAEPHDRPRHVGGEAAESGWHRPAELLVAHDAGDVILLPPTRSTLERLTTDHERGRDDAPLVPVTPVAAWRDVADGPVVVRVTAAGGRR